MEIKRIGFPKSIEEDLHSFKKYVDIRNEKTRLEIEIEEKENTSNIK